MESRTLELVYTIYQNNGPVMAILLLATGLTIYELTKYLGAVGGKYLIRRLFRRKFGWVTRNRLLHHVMFAKIDTLLNLKLKTIQITCPFRRFIFTELMTIRFNCLKKIFRDFISEVNVNKLSQAEFHQMVHDRMQAVRVCWTTAALNENVPTIAIQRFAETTDKTWQLVTSIVADYCLTTMLGQNNSDRLDGAMDIIGSMEITVFSDAEKALAAINGELKNVTYKGHKCECCPECVAENTQ